MTFNFEGVQENKKYVLEFSIKQSEGKSKRIDDSDDEIEEKPAKKSSRQKENKLPSLEDIENSHQKDFKMPKMEEPVFDRSKMKVETSFGDKKIGDA